MKVQIIKCFSDKYAARMGKPKIVEVSKDGEFAEYPDERAQELIKGGYAVEFKEKPVKKKEEK